MKFDLYTVGRSHLSDLAKGLDENNKLNKLITFWPKYKFSIPNSSIDSYFKFYFPLLIINNTFINNQIHNLIINKLKIRDNSIIDINIALKLDLSLKLNIIIDSPICSPFYQIKQWVLEEELTSIKISRLQNYLKNIDIKKIDETFNNANKIIVPSSHAKETYNNDYSEKIKVIPFWINDFIHNKNQFDRLTHKNLCFIGIICPSKGIHYLINALNKIKFNGILHLFGNIDNKKYVEYLKNLKSNNTYSLKFYGHLSQIELFKYLKNMDLNIMPSVAEGMPLSSLQALSYGVKTIASKDSSLSDVLGDDFIYETKNINDLCIKIENIFSNKTPYYFKSNSYISYLNSWFEILN